MCGQFKVPLIVTLFTHNLRFLATFEVREPLCNKLHTDLARVLDELERNQEKENHLNTISKVMGSLVHVQLYTFNYRKAVIRPQNMPKTADWG